MKTFAEMRTEADEIFAEIDGNIADLKQHIADLEQQIGSNKGLFEVTKVKRAAALKIELEEAKETLQAATARRAQMVEEFWRDQRAQGFTMHGYQDERSAELQDRYSEELKAVADSIAAMLDASQRLDVLETEERQTLREEAKLMTPYASRELRDNLSRIDMYWTPFARTIEDQRLEYVRHFLAKHRMI